MQKFILLQILAIAISYVSINDEQHCDCQELDQHDCELIPYWCSWNNETCISHNQNCESLNDYDTCLFKGFRCQWTTNSTHKYCETQNSSQYNTSLECVQHKFYWFNETCSENFTKCDDYSIDDCYYLKECDRQDGKCIDYQYPNCTDENNCWYRYTSSDQTHICKIIDQKCQKIEINNPCKSFNDSEIFCGAFDCFYEDSKCRLKTCSDILDSTECDTFVAKENGNDVWCEWKDEKCQNMIEITKLIEDTCFQSTSYNYIWKDKKCELCPNLKSNTPKYEPISKTPDPGITEITPTDPVIIDLNQRCKCSQFSENDCSRYSEYCTWDSDLYKCRPYDSQCLSKRNEAACEYAGCVWDRGQCTYFTQCSSYSYYSCPLHLGCFYGDGDSCREFSSCSDFGTNCPYNQGCAQSSFTSSYYCSTGYFCSYYSKDDCEGNYEKRNFPCYLDNDGNCKSKFTVVKFNICEDFDDSKTHCESMKGCAYVDNKCIKGKCYHFSKDKCDVQRNSNSTQTLCLWDEKNNQCGYAKLNSLSQTECLKYKNLKQPNYSSCTQCTELQDNHLEYVDQSFKQIIEKFILLELVIILIN